MPNLLRLWFGTSLTVNRQRYILSGLALAIAKFACDDAMVHVATGRSWDLLDYLSPYFRHGGEKQGLRRLLDAR
jgi:hypothetical protein